MTRATLGLVTVVLAAAAVAVPSQPRGFDSRIAGEWASAIVSVLAANANGYGPGYNYSPGYAFGRGPDIGALVTAFQTPTRPFPVAVYSTAMAQAR
jgi:hypothetical protein